MASDLAERYSRRNIALLMLDYASFSVGATFLGVTTILPGLVRQLGGSPLAVGSLATFQSGAWLLPQLVAGHYVANRPWVKKYVLGPIAFGRSLVFILSFLILLFAVRAPRLALGALLFVLATFWIADGLSSVPWFDLVAKAIPADRRGRVMGAAQSLSSLLGIGVGVLVRQVLARPNPFPANNVLLIQLAAICFGVSFLALALIREPPGAGCGEAQPGWSDYLPRLGLLWRQDPRLAWVAVNRWLAGLADMGGAFYVLFAIDRLHIPQATVGLFISASVAGSFLSGLLLGPLGDRQGPARVIAVTMALRCLCPGLALFSSVLAGAYPGLAPVAIALVFVAAGMAGSANMVGFMNYVLEIAPAGERSTYVGLVNTLGGLLILAPLVAGWLVQVASYEILFAVCLGLAMLGLLFALRRPSLRARRGAGMA